MVAFVKFECFSEHLAKKIHDLHTDVLRVYLSNTTPDVAADTIKTDLAEITNQFGYSGPFDVQNAVSNVGGVTSVTGVDLAYTASGGSFGPFRYIVLYNDNPSSPLDPLIGYWDYGSAITINDTETFSVDFSASSLFTIT